MNLIILCIKVCFWVCLFCLVYPFAMYRPLLKLLLFKTKTKPCTDIFADSWPKVMFIISAYNEEKVIADKLDNALAIQYPKEKLEIVVISDASDDNTDKIVINKSLKHDNIRLFRQKQRKGKTAGITAALKNAEAEIIVFSDANAMYDQNAIRELVKCFNHKQVGYVVGAAHYNQNAECYANKSESTYWDQELELKQMESDFCSVVGGDGAIYAIRKELFWPLQEDDINDFANPLQIVAKGYKGVFNPEAVCYEDSATDFTREYRRKRRIVNRSFRAFTRHIHSFDIRQHKKFLFLLISHKVLRWFSMFFILGFTFSAFLLSMAGEGFVYGLGLSAILLSGFLALLGKIYNEKHSCPELFYLIYYFYLVSIAGMLGIIDNFRGRYHITWDHIRKSE